MGNNDLFDPITPGEILREDFIGPLHHKSEAVI